MPSQAILDAKAKFTAIAAAQKALQTWAQINEGIQDGCRHSATALANGVPPARPVEAIKQHGELGLRLLSWVEDNQAAVSAALISLHGFTADEINEVIPYVRETLEAMRDTPDDGSELATLLTWIGSRHS